MRTFQAERRHQRLRTNECGAAGKKKKRARKAAPRAGGHACCAGVKSDDIGRFLFLCRRHAISGVSQLGQFRTRPIICTIAEAEA